MSFKRIGVIFISIVMLFAVCAQASETDDEKITAKWYVHLIDDGNVNTSEWGIQPQDSKYYFPAGNQGLEKEIKKPKEVGTNRADDGSWTVWNNIDINEYLDEGVNPFNVEDFQSLAPENFKFADNPSINWYVIKQQSDGWHVDGYVVGQIIDEPEIPKVPNNPAPPTEHPSTHQNVIHTITPIEEENPNTGADIDFALWSFILKIFCHE